MGMDAGSIPGVAGQGGCGWRGLGAVLGGQGRCGGVCFGLRAAVRSAELMRWKRRRRLLLEPTCAWGLGWGPCVTRWGHWERAMCQGMGLCQGLSLSAQGPQCVLGYQ